MVDVNTKPSGSKKDHRKGNGAVAVKGMVVGMPLNGSRMPKEARVTSKRTHGTLISIKYLSKHYKILVKNFRRKREERAINRFPVDTILKDYYLDVIVGEIMKHL